MRLLLWLVLVVGTAAILWYYRRRLAFALRILAVLYPLLLLLSLFQGSFSGDRLFLVLVMVVVGATVFIVNRLLSDEG